MRRTPYLLLVVMSLLASMTILSCGHEEPEEQKKPEDFDVNEWENTDIDGDATMSENTIQFCVGDSANVMRAATAFDGKGYTFSVGDLITIEMYRGSTKVGTKKYKVKDTSGTLEFADTGLPFVWESKAETVKLRAWSYGNATALTTEPVGSTFTLNTTQTEITTGQDNYRELLYSPQQSYGYSASLNLRLYHQMSRLTVTLTHSKTEDLSVTSITFGDGTLPVSAKFNETGIDIASSVFVGSWKDLVNGDGSTGTVTPRADVANEKYSAVLFPGTIAKDKRLITLITTDGTFAYKLPSAITLQPGKQYDYKINVKDLVPVSELTISDITGTFTYNGSAQTPKPATVKYGDKTLVEGTDYKLSWSNNINAGTATCTVTGIGTVFTGSQSKTFTINRKDLTGTADFKFASGAVTRDYIWEIATLTNALTNTNGCTVTYTSSNTNVASVTNASTGTLQPGGTLNTNATITATIVETGNYKGTATYTIKATSNNAIFTYKNSGYSITLPAGTYKFECWGADGGTGYSTYPPVGYSYGGKGGYTTGQLKLTTNATFHINVGGAGTNTSTAHYGVARSGKTVAGGYNGGGSGCEWNNNNDYVHNGAGGGGATHIATASGLLSTLSKTQVLMVAGGGGGAGGHTGTLTGGHAGGTTGLEPTDPTAHKNTFEIAQGGSQSEGGGWLVASNRTTGDYSSFATKGDFGKGGSNRLNAGGGGGGAGYYGGAGGYWKSGAGGSSYINGHSGCTKQNTIYVFQSSSTSMVTGANISSNPKPVTTSHGYARITFVSM